MKLVAVSDLFDVFYGVNLELNKLTEDPNGIPFVSRTSKNNGVSSYVKPVKGKKMNPGGTISVAGGGSVMESFLQKQPYYSGRDLYYLVPKVKMTDNVLLYYCVCLRENKYRFNYGRQANRTLKELLIPDITEIPSFVKKNDLSKFNGLEKPLVSKKITLNPENWKWFVYDDLFHIERGRGPRKNELDGTGKTPFVTSSDQNNGWTDFTRATPIHKGNTIGVNRNGSVAEAFYQPLPFCSTEDVHIFTPKFRMSKYVALFLTTLIKKEKYRYNYGRKWGIGRMKTSRIKLPVDKSGQPDWKLMEDYIKTIDYSKQI
ncbi:MAG: restriction endonuclease subunit S [Ignavibacteria bacterium]|nr:restriction endonuclease subunit S [Ignavibacteria bacterium]